MVVVEGEGENPVPILPPLLIVFHSQAHRCLIYLQQHPPHRHQQQHCHTKQERRGNHFPLSLPEQVAAPSSSKRLSSTIAVATTVLHCWLARFSDLSSSHTHKQRSHGGESFVIRAPVLSEVGLSAGCCCTGPTKATAVTA